MLLYLRQILLLSIRSGSVKTERDLVQKEADISNSEISMQVLTNPDGKAKEAIEQRHGEVILEKPLFNWDTQDRYAELVNFEMEVTNILETRAYGLTDDEKVPVIKNWLCWEGLQLIRAFIHEGNEKHRTAKGFFSQL